MYLLSTYIKLVNVYSHSYKHYLNTYKYFISLLNASSRRYSVFEMSNSLRSKNLNYYEYIYYIYILNFFFLYSNFLELSILKYGFVNMPKKYKTFTVLKSPHTDKKSREQFHLIEYKKILKYPIFISLNNSFFYYYYSIYSGIKVSNNQINYIFNL